MNDKEDGMTNEIEKIAPIEKAPWEKAARRTQTHAVLALYALQEAYDKLEKAYLEERSMAFRAEDRVRQLKASIDVFEARVDAQHFELEKLKGRLASAEQLSELRRKGLQNQQQRFARAVAKLRKGAKR